MNTGVVGGVIPCPLEILIAMAWATIVELEVETTLNRFMCRLDLPLEQSVSDFHAQFDIVHFAVASGSPSTTNPIPMVAPFRISLDYFYFGISVPRW